MQLALHQNYPKPHPNAPISELSQSTQTKHAFVYNTPHSSSAALAALRSTLRSSSCTHPSNPCTSALTLSSSHICTPHQLVPSNQLHVYKYFHNTPKRNNSNRPTPTLSRAATTNLLIAPTQTRSYTHLAGDPCIHRKYVLYCRLEVGCRVVALSNDYTTHQFVSPSKNSPKKHTTTSSYALTHHYAHIPETIASLKNACTAHNSTPTNRCFPDQPRRLRPQPLPSR